MRSTETALLFSGALLILLMSPVAAIVAEPGLAIVGGKVVTVTDGTHNGGVVLVEGKKITAVISDPGDDYTVPDGYRRIDAAGHWVVPGFIDLHSHIGGDGDLNDMVYPVNQGLRTLDGIIPENPRLRKAQAGGVTTVLFIPGSGSNMGGFGTLMKTAGKRLEDVVLRFPGALKIAQGGNPERQGGDLGSSRIGMNWIIRETLKEGKEYSEAWDAYEADKTKSKPLKNPRLELFRGLFHKEYPVVVHTQGYHLIQSTLRILHDEMGLWVVIDHGTFDSFRLADEVAKRGVMVINGPRQMRFDRRTGGFVGLAHEWRKRGVDGVGLNTDAPVVPGEELFFQAAMAVRFGLDDDAALRALTIHCAKAVGVEDRIGSLKAGKDADVVVWTGNPLDVRSSVVLTIVNGRIAYDTTKEPRRY